jgi:hypothetical protein
VLAADVVTVRVEQIAQHPTTGERQLQSAAGRRTSRSGLELATKRFESIRR